MGDLTTKITWKRAQLAVNRFVKTAETDISRLKQFKKNIIEYENGGSRAAVQRELNRAHQTMSQLKVNLRSIQSMRTSINDQEVDKFDNRLREIDVWVNEAITSFADLDPDLVEYLGEDFQQLLLTGVHNSPSPSTHPPSQQQTQKCANMQVVQLQDDLVAAESQRQRIEQLAEDVVDAKEMMTTLNSMVHEQGESVDNIESNVETALSNVKEGGIQLNKALVAKAAGYTAIGAVCGALVGGPIGFVAGAKVGLVAAGAGVAVGATVGRKMKNMQNAATEIELQNLHAASDMAETRVLRQQTANCDSD